jgi:hypothetical protein
MTLSSLLRITPRLTPTAARRTVRAASSVAGTSQGNKTLDSILIANRGEIALYVRPSLFESSVLNCMENGLIILLGVLDGPLRSMESVLRHFTLIPIVGRNMP